MTKVERAAGGLVLRSGAAGLEVLLIDDAFGKVAFPKGHVEPGETWEDAAIREVAEETGIEARIVAPLGRVHYDIFRDGQPVRKEVRLFLLRAINEADEPMPQVEELDRAYYLPWPQAQVHHEERGYANWKWIFAKAQTIAQWHDQNWEAVRHLDADDNNGALESIWGQVAPWLDALIAATEDELRAAAPEIAQQWQTQKAAAPGKVQLPRTLVDERDSLRKAIEHTLLKPEASEVDVENLCRAAAQHQVHAVCINPQHVQMATHRLDDSEVQVCTVVGFPLGATHAQALAAETAAVIGDGATEIDLVIPVGSMKEDDIWSVARAVHAVASSAHAHEGVLVKAILEAHFLTIGQLVKAAMVAVASGADLVKTSTGFAPSGARLLDVACMAVAVGPGHGVKAAGGVRSRAAAVAFLRYGATRLGTSSGPALLRQ